MTPRDPHDDPRTDAKLSRRRFVAAAGAVAGGGLAGCPRPREESLEATPVVLPPAARGELVLAEATRYSHTLAREDPTGTIRVGITNEAGLYRRGPARGAPTLVEGFVGGVNATPGSGSNVNATPGSGSAIVAAASALGVDVARPAFLGGDAAVSGDRITHVVPAGARRDGEVGLGETLAVHHGAALPVDEVTSRGGTNYLVDPREAVPVGGSLTPGSGAGLPAALARWLPGEDADRVAGTDPSSLGCLVCLGERSPEEVFGVAELPGRKIEPGETVDTEDTVFFYPAPKENPGSPVLGDPAEVFDAGTAAPLGGTTYGLVVLATPSASVAGRQVNSTVRTETADLLRGDAARRMLARATAVGGDSASGVEWLAGPTAVAGREGTCTLLGQRTPIRSYAGVASGEDGPWAVGVHVARATPDDHVVAAGVHRRPVGTVDGGRAFVEGSGWGMDHLDRARAFTAEAVGRLVGAESARRLGEVLGQ